MIRKFVLGAILAGVLIIGMVAQAGAYLLAFTPPATEQGAVDSLVPYGSRGPHSVGVRRLGVDDAPVSLTVWYPALEQPTEDTSLAYSYAINMLGPDSAIALATYQGQAEPQAAFDLSEGPYPLVVLSHGFAITASSYAWLAEHLASHGMVVVAPHHREALDPGVLWRSTLDRPQDTQSVLSYLDEAVQTGGQFEDLVDSETVGVVGHSYGGYTALAAAGARIDTAAFNAVCDSAYATGDPLVFLCDALLPRLDDIADLASVGSVSPGLWPAWSDPRVDAVVSMAGDAAMFGAPGLAEITVPVMAIGGTADTDSPFEWGTRLTYDHVSSVRKVEVALTGAAHLIFAGECDRVRRVMSLVSLGFCSDPAWDRTQGHEIVKHYVTAFLLSELNDDQAAAAALSPDVQESPNVSYQAQGY